MTTGAGSRANPGRERQFFIGLARAFAGSLIFALPMLMTMEMWWIGFWIDEWRLVILTLVLIPLLTVLSRFSGFKQTDGLVDGIVDAFVAIAAAAVMAIVVLFIFEVIRFGMPAREIIGKVALQTFPGSIGAMLARGQLSGEQQGSQDEEIAQDPSYPGELFLMGVGAIFIGLNVAPTEEIVLLSYMMGPWQVIALALLSLILMHAFVYAVNFPGQPQLAEDPGFWSLFMRFTVVGYAIVLLISAYLLWTFGRFEGADLEEVLGASIVLGFPGAIGAAAARLIL
ncbi:TIGR02587 family membrane protein [Microvirga splendida]|uniref:TIGR02587 family membrane protein n=1 Tax=Microvirga splendida TaxID=2795727 RepID=A0ABS0Y5C7_9HYPH|nr:TIGR02587 family membrane protein [Microvirga splendida]MBJ6127098.1 TIGR02587 family membrane protein [Microvirga splendida]